MPFPPSRLGTPRSAGFPDVPLLPVLPGKDTYHLISGKIPALERMPEQEDFPV